MVEIRNATNLQGAKIALLCDGQVVTYLRDDFAHIPNPGEWDLPGGVREAEETALACALRETREEFGIGVPPDAVVHEAIYVAQAPHREVAFFAAHLPRETIDRIVFGEEGQRWRMMLVEDFLDRTDAVVELQACLGAYLTERDQGQ